MKKLVIGSTVNTEDEEMGMGVIELISNYNDHQDEIDDCIEETGWESDTPREELTWYKVKTEDGECYWFDEEELNSFQ